MKKLLPKSGEARALPGSERGRRRSWFSALKPSWQATFRLDQSQMATVQAIRCAAVFFLLLAVGVATGHVLEGISMAGGAVSLGMVGLTDTYRTRTRTMLLACLGITLSAFVGGITSRIDWLAILVAGIWGIGAGLLVALGPSATVIGLQSGIGLILVSQLGLDPLHVALEAGLIFAGAVLQTLVAFIPFPWEHTTLERAVLAAAYHHLAVFAEDPANEQRGQQVREALLKAHLTLAESNLGSRRGKIFFALLQKAEHIRLCLTALTRLRQNLSGAETGQASSVADVRQLQATASELREIARALKPGPAFTRYVVSQHQHTDSLAASHWQGGPQHDEKTMPPTLAYSAALRAQLQTARQLARSGSARRRQLAADITAPPRAQLRVSSALGILRANLTLRSTAYRHALRLGFTLALATAFYRLFPQAVQHGYWIPLTALLILKPDFTATFARGMARALGTILGVVLTSVLVAVLAPTKELLVIFDVLAAFLAFTFLFANYALFSVCITATIVLLFTLVIPQPLETAGYRALDTVVGSTLALLIYALWPTWERSQATRIIADRLEALRRYFGAVMAAYANPAAYDRLTIHLRRMETRQAQANAEASVERSLQEPESYRIDVGIAQGLLGAAGAISRSVLALEAYLFHSPSRQALPEITAFTGQVDEALRLIAAAVREEQPITALLDLQEGLALLEQAVQSAQSALEEWPTDLHLVLAEAKYIASGITTLSRLLDAPAGG